MARRPALPGTGRTPHPPTESQARVRTTPSCRGLLIRLACTMPGGSATKSSMRLDAARATEVVIATKILVVLGSCRKPSGSRFRSQSVVVARRLGPCRCACGTSTRLRLRNGASRQVLGAPDVMILPISTPSAAKLPHNRVMALLYGSIRSLLESKPSYDPSAVDAAIGEFDRSGVEGERTAHERRRNGGSHSSSVRDAVKNKLLPASSPWAKFNVVRGSDPIGEEDGHLPINRRSQGGPWRLLGRKGCAGVRSARTSLRREFS